MKKLIITCLLLSLIIACGPDCPTCPDESGNLNIPAEHWKILECAGPEWPEYVRENVRCAFFIDDLKAEDGKLLYGHCDCDCNDIQILNISPSSDCTIIIHETAHLEKYCVDDQNYSWQKQGEFYDNARANNCYPEH